MSEIRNFEFSTKRAGGAKIAGTFKIDGEEFSVRVLKDSHLAFLAAKVNSTTDQTKLVVAILDFAERALTPESAKRFEALVLDPDAGLSIEQVTEVVNHVVGIVAGGMDPTGPASASASPRRRSGAASKATTPAARAGTP